jgi:hypothetical protein
MCARFIFIATNRLREGKLAAERDRAADLGSFIENTEPQLLAFNEYVNEDGTELGVVQIHPGAASMEVSHGRRRGASGTRVCAGARGDNCGREPSVTASTELRPFCDPNAPKRPEVTYTRATALGPESRS